MDRSDTYTLLDLYLYFCECGFIKFFLPTFVCLTTALKRIVNRAEQVPGKRLEASCSVATRMDRGHAVRAGECGQSGMVQSTRVAWDCATRVAQCGAGRTSRARESGVRTSAGKRCDWGAGASEQGTSLSWSKEEEYQSRPGQHEDSA